jgi:hypothetical protein
MIQLRLLAILLLMATPIPAAAQSRPSTKKLLEFGWDEPDTAFLKQHVAEMERTPFHGTVFHVDYTKPDCTRARFMNEGWSARTFTDADLPPAIDELTSTHFTRFTDNFIRFNVVPGDVDWFDDTGFAAVTSNARLAAQIARRGKAVGVLFDIEQYASPLFDYAKQRDAKTRSWDDYAAEARRRGREVMAAFQDGFGPNLKMLLTFGYSLPLSEIYPSHDPAKLRTVSYGLLAPFLDGMLDAAAPDTRLIDGFEISYGFKTRQQFLDGRHTMRDGVLPIVGADHEKYGRQFEVAFGLWMDHDWRKIAWDTTDFSKNHFTPDAFEQSLRFALEQTDEYVWIYTEKPKWWSAEGQRIDLPQEYDDAVRRAIGR